MITAAVLIALILLTSWLYGQAAIHGLGRLFNIAADRDVRPSIVILLGFCALIFIGQLFSLVMPLGLVAFLIISAGGIAIAWLLNRSGSLQIVLFSRLPALGWALLVLIGLAVLENSTHVPANPDTGIYHAQAIHWLEAYPAVSGLGNLHTRLAFNSSWLALNALFSLSFLGLRSFHFVSAALTLTAGIDFARGAIDWYRGQGTFANILRTIFLPLIFFVLGSQLSSPGTDLPVILMLWIVWPAWLDALPEVKGSNSLHGIILFTIVVTLVTVKLSAAPVLLLAAWIGLRNLKNNPAVWKMAGIAGVTLLPWIVRNIILSGYLIYPFPGIDWFNFDWKIPLETARTEVLTIQAWARDPGAAVEVVLAKPFFTWLQLWFIEKTANQKLIVLGAAVSPVIFALGLAVGHQAKKSGQERLANLVSGFLTVLLGAVYWLFTAPDIRFGYGFLLALIGMAVLPWIAWMDIHAGATAKIFRSILMVGLIAYQLFFLVRSLDAKTIHQRLVLPLDYPQLPSEPCPLGEAQVWCAAPEAWTQCWYEPFPCIPAPNEWVEMRGENWDDGFRPK
ncbi:MAG: hypothetical protein WA109_04300 [Bellilinea sp.]